VQAVYNSTRSLNLLDLYVILVDQIRYLVLNLVSRQLWLLRLILSVLVVMKHIWFFYLDFKRLIVFRQMPSEGLVEATV
jgi:hypothetical protein